MKGPQKIKNRTTYDPAIPLLGIYLKKPETPIQKTICTPMFIAVLFTIAKIWKTTKCPLYTSGLKSCGTFPQWNINLAIKKNDIICDSMDIPYNFTYMWNLKNKINKQIKQKQIHRRREQSDCYQRGGELGDWVKKVRGLRSINW